MADLRPEKKKEPEGKVTQPAEAKDCDKEKQQAQLPLLRDVWNTTVNFAEMYKRNTSNSDQYITDFKIDGQQSSKRLSLKGGDLTPDFLEQVSKKLDLNKSGQVGLGELDRKVLDRSLRGDEAAVVFSLKKNWQQLNDYFSRSFSDRLKDNLEFDNIRPKLDRLGESLELPITNSMQVKREMDHKYGGSEGFSRFREELKDYNRENALHVRDLAQMIQSRKFYEALNKEPDKEHRITVSKADIDAVLSGSDKEVIEKFKSKFNQDPSKAAAFLKEHFAKYAQDEPEKGVLTGSDLGTWSNRSDQIKNMWKSLSDSFEEGREKLAKYDQGSKYLYGGSDDPLRSIVPEAIQQGTVGDCYFLGALASLARTNPKAIRDMISYDEKNKSYVVRFPGAPDEPISVKAPTRLEQSLFCESTKHGTWPAIIEKAYGEYCNREPSRRSLRNPWQRNLPQEAADGGAADAAFTILTGKKQESFKTDLDEKALEDRLSQITSQKKPAIVSFPGHIASMVAYDRKSQELTIYDQDRNNDKTYKMKLAEIKEKIQSFTFSH